MNNILKIRVIFLFLIFMISASTIFAQSKIKVGIFPVINDTKLPYIDALSTTAEDNIHFLMTQLESYQPVDQRNSEVLSFQIKNLRNAAKKKDCDYIIYGSISGRSPFTLSMFLYERNTNKITAKRTGTIQRMTEIFSVSDKLALSLLEDLTGEQIKRGELRVVDKGTSGSFIVSINNRKLDQGVSSVLLMKGKYKVKIVGLIGNKKKTLYSGKVTIEEGQPTIIEFGSDQPKTTNKSTQDFNTRKIHRTTLRITAGTLILQKADFENSEFTMGNVPGGDIGYIKLNYSTRSKKTGFGFTVGIAAGGGGLFNETDLYPLEETPNSYIPTIYLALEPGICLQTKWIGFYLVLNMGFSMGEIEIDSITKSYTHWLIGPTLGVDLLFFPAFPITIEFGVSGGTGVITVDNERESQFGISGLSLGIGAGISF